MYPCRVKHLAAIIGFGVVRVIFRCRTAKTRASPTFAPRQPGCGVCDPLLRGAGSLPRAFCRWSPGVSSAGQCARRRCRAGEERTPDELPGSPDRSGPLGPGCPESSYPPFLGASPWITGARPCPTGRKAERSRVRQPRAPAAGLPLPALSSAPRIGPTRNTPAKPSQKAVARLGGGRMRFPMSSPLQRSLGPSTAPCWAFSPYR